MKTAFLYFLKNRSKTMLITTFAMIIILFFHLINTTFVYQYEGVIEPRGEVLVAIAVLGGIVATIIPICEFSFKMKKRNIDVFYALPIKKLHLYVSKFLVGLIEVLVPLSVGYLFNFVYVICHENAYELIYFLFYYFELIFVIAALYTFVTFFYLQGNTIIDGIISIALGSFVLTIITLGLSAIFSSITIYNLIDSSFFTAYSPLTVITSINVTLMNGNEPSEWYWTGTFSCLIVYFIVTVLTLIGIYFTIKKDKAENSMQISESPFLYKTMIPIYLVCIGISIEYYGDALMTIAVVAISAYLLYCAYQRRFVLTKKYVISLFAFLIIGVLGSLLLLATRNLISYFW